VCLSTGATAPILQTAEVPLASTANVSLEPHLPGLGRAAASTEPAAAVTPTSGPVLFLWCSLSGGDREQERTGDEQVSCHQILHLPSARRRSVNERERKIILASPPDPAERLS